MLLKNDETQVGTHGGLAERGHSGILKVVAI